MMLTEKDIQRSAQLVARCEHEFGHFLSQGQVVDLICDNSPDDEEQWSLAKCQEIAKSLFAGGGVGPFHMAEARKAAPTWGRISRAKVQRPTLLDAIEQKCGGLYRIKELGPTAIVRGQAFTYLQKDLRLDGWRSMTYANITHTIANSGGRFAFSRGRGRRIAHGGKMAWGTVCEVTYIVASRSDITDEQLARQEADEVAAGRF